MIRIKTTKTNVTNTYRLLDSVKFYGTTMSNSGNYICVTDC